MIQITFLFAVSKNLEQMKKTDKGKGEREDSNVLLPPPLRWKYLIIKIIIRSKRERKIPKDY